MTSKELAKLLQLSEASVSLALNGRAGVSEKTRQRVLEAAAEYGLSSERAQAKLQGAIACLSVPVGEVTDLSEYPFFRSVYEGMEAVCEENGYTLEHYSVSGEEDLANTVHQVLNDGAAGILLMATFLREQDLACLSRLTAPLVIVDNHFRGGRWNEVAIDNYESGYEAATYMMTETRSLPGYIHGEVPIDNFRGRYLGYRDALAPFLKDGECPDEFDISLTDEEDAVKKILSMAKEGHKFAGAYVCDNDYGALFALEAFKKVGIKVPDQVSLIGFDDIALTAASEPPITTMHVPGQYYGRTAAERLMRIIREKYSYPLQVRVPAALVVRDSVKRRPLM